MKKIIVISVLALTQLTSFGQNVEEIVSSYLENIGGVEKLKEIKGTRMVANTKSQGMDIPLDITMLSNGKSMVSFELQGKKMVQQAFDGEDLWGVNFMSMKAEKKDAEETENYKRMMHDFPNAFMKYKELGYSLELMGKESVEGAECHKIKMVKKPQLVDGKEVENVTYYYFDTENFVPIMEETDIKFGPMKGKTSQKIYSDYQEVNGIYFPFEIRSKIKDGEGSSIMVEKIDINPEVDESTFKFVN